MSITSLILKSMLIGAIGSVPVGPIVMLTLNKTLSSGQRAGMYCAMGAVISDTIFAMLAMFAFNLTANLMDGYSTTIEIVGGAIIIAVGIGMLFRREVPRERISATKALYDSGKSLMIGLVNPGSFLYILAAFASGGFEVGEMTFIESMLAVAGVFAGSFLYWLILTYLASKGKGRLGLATLHRINKLFGIAVILFGIYFIVKGIMA